MHAHAPRWAHAQEAALHGLMNSNPLFLPTDACMQAVPAIKEGIVDRLAKPEQIGEAFGSLAFGRWAVHHE